MSMPQSLAHFAGAGLNAAVILQILAFPSGRFGLGNAHASSVISFINRIF
jgi:hypothetical protein